MFIEVLSCRFFLCFFVFCGVEEGVDLGFVFYFDFDEPAVIVGAAVDGLGGVIEFFVDGGDFSADWCVDF